MAALLVERSAIDLRTQVTVNGTCSISSSEVKFLLTDSVRAKVWAVQSLSFSIWYGFDTLVYVMLLFSHLSISNLFYFSI